MKQDTADAFKNDAAIYGGTAFLAALRDRIDPAAPPRITLVGHSTGAVFISEFITHAAATLPSEVQFGVVFEAPASTCAKTAETLAQHRARIANFRMFTMSEAYELDDKLVPVIYPHSLLYFVSGVVEFEADAPLVGMARFYEANHFPPGGFPDVATVRDFVAESTGHAVWSVTEDTAPAGQRSHAEGHTEFDDDDEETLESVKHILREGF
jgi:pimeloyl-ACP methyl ester carboxylesterase